jgi:hypothetical protein
MKTLLQNRNTLLVIILGLFAWVIIAGCEKEMKDYTFIPERQFTPGDIAIRAGEIDAVLTWNASLFATPATDYTVQVSADSNFAGTPLASIIVSRPTVTVTDSILEIKKDYYARIKANSTAASAESFWVKSAKFQITGEQIFLPVQDAEVGDKFVTLRWRSTTGLTKITLTPVVGAAIEVPLTAADVAANFKLVTGLTPLTQYEAKVFRGNTQKGLITFTTKELNIFTVKLKPGDDIIAAVSAAVSGDVIGLEPGTHDIKNALGEYANLRIEQKSITIASVSKNPDDTRVNFREITIAGSGAGVILRDLTFDGLAAGSSSLYFLNFVGLASDNAPADFTNVEVNNCRVGNFGNCLLRANRASNNAHKIDAIKVLNSIVYDNRTLNAYTYFTLDKLEFKRLELKNSTFYNIGRGFILWSTNITVPAAPVILIDQCTINSFGRDARNNFFIDCNANQVDFTVSNSIIANSPMAGQTTGTSLVRASAAVSAVMNNCNYFGLTNGAAPPVSLEFPAFISQSSMTTIDLGWTPATTNFTLPAGSPLRTASATGGPIGDIRWAL